jgi:hypothetical protein
MLRMLHHMTGPGRLQYGLLDDENRVIRWLDYPPANSRYITRKLPRKRAARPTIETYGAARW